MIRKFLVVVFTCVAFAIHPVLAQSTYFLKLIPTHLNQSLSVSKHRLDSLEMIQEITDGLHQLHQQSFITASLDSVYITKDSVVASIHIGKSYQWVRLSARQVPEFIIKSIRFKEKLYWNRRFNYKQIARLHEDIIYFLENNGYPFASSKLDSIYIQEEKINAILKVDLGPLIYFDSLTIYGTAKVKKSFLASYIGLTKGEIFSVQRLKRANRILPQLTYLKQVRPSQILFRNFRAYPVFFLDYNKSNRLDGFIGILPNAPGNSKLLITGQLNVRLLNLFSTGKGLELEWIRQKPLSQTATLSYFHPNLFNTGIDAKFKFTLFKEDTSFINTTGRIAFSRFLNKLQGKMNLYLDYKIARTFSIPASITKQQLLPDLVDFDLFSYGIGYEWNNLDDYLFPTKGINIKIDLLVGNKAIKNSFNLSDSLRNKIDLNSFQFQSVFLIENYIKIKNRHILLHKLNGGMIVNKTIFINDLFRIGGLTTLRGFNENFFYASTYAIHTIEYRYYMTSDTYLLGFYDQGYTQYNTTDFYHDYPSGIGAGISLSTNAGIFSFVYSLGKSKDQSITFTNSKIHFGFINRF